MSIKQNGGVFGRNPTFNDVTIDGTLTFDGDIDINSDLKIDGDLEVTGTSSLTGNVGVGVAASGIQLDVIDAGLSTQFRISNTASDATTKYGAVLGRHYTNAEENLTGMLLTSSSSSTGGTVSIGGGISGANAANNIVFYTAPNSTTLIGSEAARFNTSGNLAFVSGKGIDFSATAGTGTSELFSDYEEGVWTPATVTGTVGVSGSATYTKVGNLVTLRATLVSFSDRSTASNIIITGIPFSSGTLQAGGTIFGRDIAKNATAALDAYSKIIFYTVSSSSSYVALQHADLSSSSGAAIYLEATYLTS